jgi:hypothetical protein
VTKIRKQKSYQNVIHKELGIRFDIVGAKICSIGNCFVVMEENDLTGRERIFQTDMFDRKDFPAVVRNALFLQLAEKESKRVKQKLLKEAAIERGRQAQARAESDAEDEYVEQQYRDLGEESSAEYEPDDPPLPIEDSEIISDEDTEGHEQLPEVEEEEEIEVLEE